MSYVFISTTMPIVYSYSWGVGQERNMARQQSAYNDAVWDIASKLSKGER